MLHRPRLLRLLVICYIDFFCTGLVSSDGFQVVYLVWWGWVRQLARAHHETDRPICNPQHALSLEENPSVLVETLGTLHRRIP